MRGYAPFLGEVPVLGQRGETLLGQARIMPPGLPRPVFPNPVITRSRRFYVDESGVIRFKGDTPPDLVTMDDFFYGEPVPQPPVETPGVESGCPEGWIREPGTGRCLPPTPSVDRSRLPGGLLTATAFGAFGGSGGVVAPTLGSVRFRVVNLR